MKHVLIFVITSHASPYNEMTTTSMETWDRDSVAGTRTVFYAGKGAEPDTDRVISFPVHESYLTMGYKNLLAYEWALKQPGWDYMARVNASCYVHKRRLREYVQGLPETGLFRGVKVPDSGTGEGEYMWGGAQFLFSRDVVELMVANGEKWQHNVMEDVAVSRLLRDLGVKLDGAGMACSINRREKDWLCVTYGSHVTSFEFTNLEEINRQPDQFFFRVKHDADRSVDKMVMLALKVHLPE